MPRHIARVNIHMCFPELSEQEVDSLAARNARVAAKVMFDYGAPAFRSKHHLHKRVQVHGWEHIEALQQSNQTAIFLVPHTWPIYTSVLAVVCQASQLKTCTLFTSLPNPVHTWFMTWPHVRDGHKLYQRRAGIDAIINAVADGHSAFFSPDLDFGERGSLFVPFFGTTKATLHALPRLARLTGARVIPMLALVITESFVRYRPSGGFAPASLTLVLGPWYPGQASGINLDGDQLMFVQPGDPRPHTNG